MLGESILKDLKQQGTIKDLIRLQVDVLDEICKESECLVQTIHLKTTQDFREICKNIVKTVEKTKNVYGELKKVIPEGEFYKFNSFWNSKVIQLVGDFSLAYWLLNNELCDIEKVREHMGQEISLDEYLSGITGITSELSRLTMNLVIRGDYKTPQKIDQFLKDFYNGFKLMNLKNDALRKKFDSIKYDVKKVEQVIYDLKINNLI